MVLLTRSVVPGETVLLRMTCCPSRRCGDSSSTRRMSPERMGLKFSSTGVPRMITITSASRASARSVVIRKFSEATHFSSRASAPSSWKGIEPELICSTAASFTSMPIVSLPLSAKTRARGSPT